MVMILSSIKLSVVLVFVFTSGVVDFDVSIPAIYLLSNDKASSKSGCIVEVRSFGLLPTKDNSPWSWGSTMCCKSAKVILSKPLLEFFCMIGVTNNISNNSNWTLPGIKAAVIGSLINVVFCRWNKAWYRGNRTLRC